MANKAKVTGSKTLAEFKAHHNVANFDICISDKGNKYACLDGDIKASISAELDTTKPIMVFFMEKADEDTGEISSWAFMGNGTPMEKVGTI